MLGQHFTGDISDSSRRIFVYEVAGLSETELTALSQAPIRASHNQFVQVPFSRMNQEMQRILSLGGKIVNIQPLDAKNAAAATGRSAPEEAGSEVQAEATAAAEAE